MSRIGIAISGGPNPAEIIDLVVLAESLGYQVGLGRRRSWRRPVRDPGGLRDADLAHPARHQHQQRLCPHRADDRDGRLLGRRPVRRAVHSRAWVEPQGAGRPRAWRCVRQAADPHPRDRCDRPRTDPRRARELSRRDHPHREFRSVVHAAAPGYTGLPLGRVPERDRPVRRSRRRHHPDAQHVAHGRAGADASRRRCPQRRTRPRPRSRSPPYCRPLSAIREMRRSPRCARVSRSIAGSSHATTG